MGPPSRTPAILLPDALGARDEIAHWAARAGWVLRSASQPGELLASLSSGSVDIVIADDDLPPFDADLLLRVRQQFPFLPIVLVSDSADRLRVEDSSCLEVVGKNTEGAQIAQAVQRLLRVAAAQQRENRIYVHALREVTSWSARTIDAAGIDFPLPILERLHRAGCIPQAQRLQLELAFQEAFSNSLEHGNLELQSRWRDEFDSEGYDRFSRERAIRLQNPTYANRRISVDSVWDGGLLTISIRDEGPGFEPGELPAPSVDKPELHGRGLALIRRYMDQVEFRLGGREIVMSKRLHSLSPQREA